MAGKTARKTTAQFVLEAHNKHGLGHYDYSITTYKGANKKLLILCHTHGSFEQTASSHLGGCGCPKCANINKGAYLVPTTEQFIQKAKAKHGNVYDYSAVSYSGDKGKILINCFAHGQFEQIASNHLQGQGCPMCGYKKSGRYDTLDTDAFIDKAIDTHGNRYFYDGVNYKNAATKVAINCPQHGEFWQRPSQHLIGKGCPSCGHESRARKNELSWLQKAQGRVATLYFLRFSDDFEEFFKVGITFHTVKERFHSKISLAGYEYEILAIHKSSDTRAVYEWEQSIIETFSHLRYSPLRSLPGATECFSSCDEILAIFPL